MPEIEKITPPPPKVEMSDENGDSHHSSFIANHSEHSEGQLVVFRLSDEEFGVDIDKVKEIVRLPDITPIPRAPEYISGICNLRGNVLPVIDTRIRFAMPHQEATDHTRLLVVETQGIQTGLIVDNVREVMRLNYALVEPPPSVCRGVEREFLHGVVKVDQGKRLILILNLNEVLFVDMQEHDKVGTTEQQHVSPEEQRRQEETISEEQLVSFHVAGDEYAFDISKVREIIKITEITAVPNVPGYVKGLLTIRNQLLPIIELRELLGLPSLISERHAMIDRAIQEDRSLADNIAHAVKAGTHFTGTLKVKETAFGKWLEEYNTSSVELETVVKRLKRARADLFSIAYLVMDMNAKAKDSALQMLEEKIQPQLSVVMDVLAELKTTMAACIMEDQRALVVESDKMTVGYLVDWVDEVSRIPKSVIDVTPAIASSERQELKAVAKLDNGERLIMIMDESMIVSSETSSLLSNIRETVENESQKITEAQEKTLAQQSLDEVQLVTFSINTEEYAIQIMQVQEINRISDITPVPRAPYFIDGMTNLRGNVIPVLNIRRLFGLQDKTMDDRSRIIIVDIQGNKTGLRVDQVNEVLRIPRNDILKTPSIAASAANQYMEGVCKIDKGKRLVVLLDVKRILDEEELKNLAQIAKSAEMEKAPAAKPLRTKTDKTGAKKSLKKKSD